jgi:hypothetical protein
MVLMLRWKCLRRSCKPMYPRCASPIRVIALKSTAIFQQKRMGLDISENLRDPMTTTSVPFNLQHIDHVLLLVKGVERALAFYEALAQKSKRACLRMRW